MKSMKRVTYLTITILAISLIGFSCKKAYDDLVEIKVDNLKGTSWDFVSFKYDGKTYTNPNDLKKFDWHEGGDFRPSFLVKEIEITNQNSPTITFYSYSGGSIGDTFTILNNTLLLNHIDDIIFHIDLDFWNDSKGKKLKLEFAEESTEEVPRGGIYIFKKGK